MKTVMSSLYCQIDNEDQMRKQMSKHLDLFKDINCKL